MESIREAIDFIGGPGTLWILAGVYFGSVFLERVWAIKGNPEYDNADALCSIGLNLISSVLNLVIAMLIPLALYVLVFDQFRMVGDMALWLAIPLAFVMHELA